MPENKIERIAHYTTWQALKSILENQELWATHYRFLNDSSEVSHGMECIDSIFKLEIEKFPTKLQKLKDLILQKHPSDSLDERIRVSWLQGLAYRALPEFFVTSFCEIGSDEGVLSQWRGYGNSGGYAIVFDYDTIKQSYKKHAEEKCAKHSMDVEKSSECRQCKGFEAHLLASVDYEHDIEKIKKFDVVSDLSVYDAVELHAKEVYRALIDDSRTSHSPENASAIFKAVIWLLSTMKHPAFSEEKEIRFVCLNRAERYEENGGGYHHESPYPISLENDVPRLKIKFEPLAIKKIIIGPGSKLEQDRKKVLIGYYLELYGYHNVEIVVSSIPYV